MATQVQMLEALSDMLANTKTNYEQAKAKFVERVELNPSDAITWEAARVTPTMLPIYEIARVESYSNPNGWPARVVAEAEGIDNARFAVAQLLLEGEAAELEIVLDGRIVEIGKQVDGTVEWIVLGRGRDLL